MPCLSGEEESRLQELEIAVGSQGHVYSQFSMYRDMVVQIQTAPRWWEEKKDLPNINWLSSPREVKNFIKTVTINPIHNRKRLQKTKKHRSKRQVQGGEHKGENKALYNAMETYFPVDVLYTVLSFLSLSELMDLAATNSFFHHHLCPSSPAWNMYLIVHVLPMLNMTLPAFQRATKNLESSSIFHTLQHMGLYDYPALVRWLETLSPSSKRKLHAIFTLRTPSERKHILIHHLSCSSLFCGGDTVAHTHVHGLYLSSPRHILLDPPKNADTYYDPLSTILHHENLTLYWRFLCDMIPKIDHLIASSQGGSKGLVTGLCVQTLKWMQERQCGLSRKSSRKLRCPPEAVLLGLHLLVLINSEALDDRTPYPEWSSSIDFSSLLDQHYHGLKGQQNQERVYWQNHVMPRDQDTVNVYLPLVDWDLNTVNENADRVFSECRYLERSMDKGIEFLSSIVNMVEQIKANNKAEGGNASFLSPSRSQAMINKYKTFFKVKGGPRGVECTDQDVDFVYHFHILNLVNYSSYCMAKFNRFIHHKFLSAH